MSESQHNERKRSLAERFWDMYEGKGAGFAMLLLASEFAFDDKGVSTALPLIMKEARARKIPMTQFLQEFEDATGVNNDGGGIPSDGDSQDHRDQDADGASQARDADGQDQDGREDSTPGKDV